MATTRTRPTKPAKATKPAKSTKPAPALPTDIDATCSRIEAYFDALRAAEIPDLELYDEPLPPQRPAAIDALSKTLKTPIPDALRAFLARGLRGARGSIAEPFAALGFDFVKTDMIAKHTRLLRRVADSPTTARDDPHAALVRRGIVITYEEPMLLVADDGVYHFSFRNPLLRVAEDLGAFLEHWLASGCFGSHSFDTLWKRVKPYAPPGVPLAKNTWIIAYKRQYQRP